MSTGNLGKNLHVDVSQRPAYTSRPAMSHGLLGAQYVTQHMMIDDNWSIQQLIDQFDDVKRVMKTHETIKQIQKRAVTFRVDKVIRKLRTQVHNGRLLLNLHRLHTNKQVMQYLEGDKAKTRLYQKLPLHEISESIDHQTFVMRKEHDQGKKKAAFKKKLAASAIRLKAAQTINSTYKKIIEVLLKDATYYDVIIRSLVDDIKDQDNYVNYILDVGKPAFTLFRVLSLNYVKRRDKVQKTLRKFNESLQRNTIKLRRGSSGFLEANATKNLDVFNIRERYERSSQSMRAMEKHLEIVTNMIRDLKTATLTSNSTKIYKTIKNQQPINRFMHKEIQLDDLRYKTMIIKKEINETARVIIYHNFNVPQMNMSRKAWLLKAAIEGQDMYGARISKHMKERSKLFVLIRGIRMAAYSSKFSAHREQTLSKLTNAYRPIVSHAFLGLNFVKQHMMSDGSWCFQHLVDQMEQFKRMMKTYQSVSNLEKKAESAMYKEVLQKLRNNVHDGRLLLCACKNQKQTGSNNFKDKTSARLYKDMSLLEISERVDQQSFVLRKEYDRLHFRCGELKQKLHSLVLERDYIRTRIVFFNNFPLEEGEKAKLCRNKIQASRMRLKAAQTINTTYKKIIKILRNDANYYEPIIRSLINDIKDQEGYINFIIGVGNPALEQFRKLSNFHTRKRDATQRTLTRFYKDIMDHLHTGIKKSGRPSANKVASASELINRYNRSSKDMQTLEIELSKVEAVIKHLETVTLSSQSTEVYRTIRTQSGANAKLQRWLQFGALANEMLEIKTQKSEIVRNLLRHNYNGWPRKNEFIEKKLRSAIKREDEYEAHLVQQMREISPYIVLIRFTLYRLNDMLRVVNYRSRTPAMRYPNADLKLPLLKFESTPGRAYPPLPFEENLENLMKVVQEKLKKLLKAFTIKTQTENLMEKHRHIYNQQLRKSYKRGDDEDSNLDHLYQHSRISDDIDEEASTTKIWAGVPNRARIKQRSAAIIEEQRRLVAGH
uniref:Uncharacterized protein n=1 Tax=Glossina palpalis gambiensis TaxID=67801 RepID=A0A1B0BY78_9MUSC